MATYRKALSEIMQFAEHRAMYYNPGVQDDRVLSRINAHLRQQAFGSYGKVEPYEVDENRAMLSALNAQGDLTEYPIEGKKGELVRRIRSKAPAAPRRKDNRIEVDGMGGALSDTFGPRPPSTKPRSPKNSPKSSPPSGRPSRSPPNDHKEPSTTAQKLDSLSKKRKSPSPTSIAPRSPTKRRKSPSAADVEARRQQQQQASSPGAAPGLTRNVKKKNFPSAFAKKLEDMGKEMK